MSTDRATTGLGEEHEVALPAESPVPDPSTALLEAEERRCPRTTSQGMPECGKVVILKRLADLGYTEGYGALVHLIALMGPDAEELRPESAITHRVPSWMSSRGDGSESGTPRSAMSILASSAVSASVAMGHSSVFERFRRLNSLRRASARTR